MPNLILPSKPKLKKLYLIRGASGSGKSTLATELVGAANAIAADDFPGLYNPDGSYNILLQADSHRWCEAKATEMMQKGIPAIAVANTFSALQHLRPYMDAAKRFGYRISIIRTEGNYGSIHNVPEEVRQRQLGTYQPWGEVGVKAVEIAMYSLVKQTDDKAFAIDQLEAIIAELKASI